MSNNEKLMELSALLDSLHQRIERLEDLSNALDARATQDENDLAECVTFLQDVFLNKYPTKPRIIAATGRLLQKIGVR